MDKAVFNDKFGTWLYEQQKFLADYDQEKLFDLPKTIADHDVPQDAQELINAVFGRFLKLSFIVRNHRKELDKLIDYLD